MLFDQVVFEYINDKQFGRKAVRANTMEGYLSAIKCHLMPRWQNREIESITCEELQEWADGFVLAGAAAKAFKTFRQIYRWYLKKYKVRIWDETQGVELKKAPRREPTALSAQEVNEAIHDVIGQDIDAGVIVQSSIGCRPCEVCALQWKDVNLSNGEVKIYRGKHKAFGEVYESPTKTEKSNRVVVLPRYAVLALREVKRLRNAQANDYLVIGDPTVYRRHVRAWFKRRGIKMNAQNLRHTFATLAVESGLDALVIAAMLGHASLDMLYQRYFAKSARVFRTQMSSFNDVVLTAAPAARLVA